VPRKYECRKYTLDDGSVWTIPQIVEETGLGKNTVYWRIRKTDNKESIFAPPSDRRTRKLVGDVKSLADERVCSLLEKEVIVLWGIPLNPSCMDGLGDKDREGNELRNLEQTSLMQYRQCDRDAWRDGSDNILNRVGVEDER